MIDLSDLSNTELADRIDDAIIAENFAESKQWALIKEASDRIASKARDELLNTDPVNEAGRIMELQITIKVLQNILPGIVRGLREEGKLAFAVYHDRGLDETT